MKTQQAVQDDPGNLPTPRPSNSSLPAVIDLPEEEAGAGTEALSKRDRVIPWVRSLHYSCPEITEDDVGYVRGAKPGMLLNISTKQLYQNTLWNKSSGLLIIPVYASADYVEWVPIRSGGGFVGRHEEDSQFVRAAKGDKKDWFEPIPCEGGHELIETKYLHYLIEDEESGSLSPAVTAFSSTRIKGFREFVSRDREITYPDKNGKIVKPPIWMHHWRLFTVPDSNEKGKWFVYRIELVGDLVEPRLSRREANLASRIERNDMRYQAGWEFYKMIIEHPDAAGRAVTARPERESELEQEIPF